MRNYHRIIYCWKILFLVNKKKILINSNKNFKHVLIGICTSEIVSGFINERYVQSRKMPTLAFYRVYLSHINTFYYRYSQ